MINTFIPPPHPYYYISPPLILYPNYPIIHYAPINIVAYPKTCSAISQHLATEGLDLNTQSLMSCHKIHKTHSTISTSFLNIKL